MLESLASQLRLTLRACAREAGFPLAGVAPAEPPPGAERLPEWLARGYAGEMGYLARDPGRRSDPRRVMPEARSVVMVAAPYLPPGPEAGPPREAAVEPRASAEPAARGRVSAYARGDDYHRLMEEGLGRLAVSLGEALARAAAELSPAERAALLGGERALFRRYCDHGPLLERQLAARAGLGWIGKNTLLLHRAHGSWFFLGALLTSAALPLDGPQEEYCGSCRACLDACPTGAFVAPHLLDARRCISYLTIELRGPIPRELRPLIGTRVFGCDDCQTACPWTPPGPARPAPEPAPPLFAPRGELAAPELRGLLAMTEDRFARRFGGTAMARARRRGLRRNAAVALGNAGRAEDLPALAAALADADPLLRGHAAWALGELARRLGKACAAAARAALAPARERETDDWAAGEIRAALDDLREGDSAP